MDASHCFAPTCMEQLRRVVDEAGAELIISSSWRSFEHARDFLAEGLARYGLAFREWTTTAGGESCNARVDQILTFANTASGVCTWAVLDDEDLAPAANAGTESLMRAVFRQRFVRTSAKTGLDVAAADRVIATLLDGGDDDDGGGSEAQEELTGPQGEHVGSAARDAGTLARLCVRHFESVGWGHAAVLEQVSSSLLQNLWSGLGSVLDISVLAVGCQEERHIVAKLIGPPPDPGDFEECRDHASYFVEASFYEQGHARAVCELGARCPLPLLVERTEGSHVRICMTRLPGRFCERQGAVEVKLALDWLARLHAGYWGHERADAAVASGLQEQGCYWNLDARQKELRRTPSKGLEGRLALAARALDARLKADRMQTICHGDPKDSNMLFAEDGSAVAMYDFQWVGKAPPSKDLAYCLACAAGFLSPDEEAEYVRFYHGRLTGLLAAQGDEVPSLKELLESYTLAMSDLARWMSGWGWWGHVEVLQLHSKTVLEKLDGGCRLASDAEYLERVWQVFPP